MHICVYLCLVLCSGFWYFRSARSHLTVPGKACSYTTFLNSDRTFVQHGNLISSRHPSYFCWTSGLHVLSMSLVGWFVCFEVVLFGFVNTFWLFFVCVCAFPQLEKKHCRVVEGTKWHPVPGEYVLICACKTSQGENSSYALLAKTFF